MVDNFHSKVNFSCGILCTYFFLWIFIDGFSFANVIPTLIWFDLYFFKHLGVCPKTVIKQIKQIASTIVYDPETIHYLLNCFLDGSRFFLCSFYHQTCAVDQTSNRIKPSPPCQEMIDIMETQPECNFTFKYLNKLPLLNKLCPKLFAGDRMNFKVYPRKNMQKLETCQMDNSGLFYFKSFKISVLDY